MSRHLTPEEIEQFKIDYPTIHDQEELERKYRPRSFINLMSLAHRLGVRRPLSLRGRPVKSKLSKERLLELYGDRSVKLKTISKKAGITIGAIVAIVRKSGVPRRNVSSGSPVIPR